MKFKTFDFEGRKIRASRLVEEDVRLAIEDVHQFTDYLDASDMRDDAFRPCMLAFPYLNEGVLDACILEWVPACEVYQMVSYSFIDRDRSERFMAFLKDVVGSWGDEENLTERSGVGSDPVKENTSISRRDEMCITSRNVAAMLGVAHERVLAVLEDLIERLGALPTADRTDIVMFRKYADALGYQMNETGFFMLASEIEEVPYLDKAWALLAIKKYIEYGSPLPNHPRRN